MDVRFMPGLQAVMIIAPIVLLLAYVIWVYALTREVGLQSVVKRLIGAAAFMAIIWKIIDAFLFTIGWIDAGSSITVAYDVMAATHRASIGLPSRVFREIGGQYMPEGIVSLFLFLLLTGALVAAVQSLLAKSRWAIEKHQTQYFSALAGISLVVLSVLLWPQPARHPGMPAVTIPEEALRVSFTYTNDEQGWPVTTFSVGSNSKVDIQDFYEQTLPQEEWPLVTSDSQSDPGGIRTGKATFSNGTEVLELKVTEYYDQHAVLIKRPVRGTE